MGLFRSSEICNRTYLYVGALLEGSETLTLYVNVETPNFNTAGYKKKKDF